jgi:hypothetical protein
VESGDTLARGRIAIAVVAAVVLAAVVVVIVGGGGGGGGDERSVAGLPSECVDKWNSDPAAIAFGRHNFNGHGYEAALVTYLTKAGDEVPSADEGLCAVIFPSQVLDPEPVAAGEVVLAGEWTPISVLPDVELNRVAELQVIAAGDPNTRLESTGELSAL